MTFWEPPSVASCSIYLFHLLIFTFTHQAIAWSGLAAVGKSEILANFASYMITATAAGMAIPLAVEKPLTQYGIGLIRRKPSTPAVARWAGKAFPLNAWSSLDRSAKPFDL
jgi:peptidoglycan/LPS O-acetylase OafA/YrhL